MDAHDASVAAPGSRSDPAWPRLLKPLLGYMTAGLTLLWVFHGVNLGDMATRVSAMNWWWLVPAVACDILSYLCQGVRWHLLLRPVGRLPVLRATQAIYAGLFTNELVPMRFGEVVRAYLGGKWMARAASTLIPSMLVERVLDGVWMAGSIGMAAGLLPLPHDLLMTAGLLGGGLVAAIGLLAVLMVRQPPVLSRWVQQNRSRCTALGRLKAFIARIALGLGAISDPRLLSLAAVFSLGLLAFQAAAFWLVMRAYGLPLPFTAGLAVFLIVHLGTAVPNAPANVGPYQFFTVLGLRLFGVEKTLATGFSVVVFLVLTLPLWGLGLVALAQSGATLSGIRRDLRRGLDSGDADPVQEADACRCHATHESP